MRLSVGHSHVRLLPPPRKSPARCERLRHSGSAQRASAVLAPLIVVSPCQWRKRAPNTGLATVAKASGTGKRPSESLLPAVTLKNTGYQAPSLALGSRLRNRR